MFGSDNYWLTITEASNCRESERKHEAAETEIKCFLVEFRKFQTNFSLLATFREVCWGSAGTGSGGSGTLQVSACRMNPEVKTQLHNDSLIHFLTTETMFSGNLFIQNSIWTRVQTKLCHVCWFFLFIYFHHVFLAAVKLEVFQTVSSEPAALFQLHLINSTFSENKWKFPNNEQNQVISRSRLSDRTRKSSSLKFPLFFMISTQQALNLFKCFYWLKCFHIYIYFLGRWYFLYPVTQNDPHVIIRVRNDETWVCFCCSIKPSFSPGS